MIKDKLLEIMRSVRACVDYSRYHWKTLAEGETLELALKGVDILQSIVDMKDGEPDEYEVGSFKQGYPCSFVTKENRDWWKFKAINKHLSSHYELQQHTFEVQNQLDEANAKLKYAHNVIDQLSTRQSSVADKPVMTTAQFYALNDLIQSWVNLRNGVNTSCDMASAMKKALKVLCSVPDIYSDQFK